VHRIVGEGPSAALEASGDGVGDRPDHHPLGEEVGVAARGDGVTDLGVGVWGDVAEDRLIGIRARGSCEGAADLLPEEGTRQANLRVEDGDDERIVVGDRHHGADDARGTHHAHVGLDAVTAPLVDGVVDLTGVRHTIDHSGDDDCRGVDGEAVGSVETRQQAVGFGILHLTSQEGIGRT